MAVLPTNSIVGIPFGCTSRILVASLTHWCLHTCNIASKVLHVATNIQTSTTTNLDVFRSVKIIVSMYKLELV